MNNIQLILAHASLLPRQWEDEERAIYDLETMIKEFQERLRPVDCREMDRRRDGMSSGLFPSPSSRASASQAAHPHSPRQSFAHRVSHVQGS